MGAVTERFLRPSVKSVQSVAYPNLSLGRLDHRPARLVLIQHLGSDFLA